jgi:hypothetical protein
VLLIKKLVLVVPQMGGHFIFRSATSFPSPAPGRVLHYVVR